MTAKQLAAIEAHGKRLLAIFPAAEPHDPVQLCRVLRRLENHATSLTTALCNGMGPAGEAGAERSLARVMDRAYKVLGLDPAAPDVPVFVNRDPRGYALKIRSEWMATHRANLHRDWGGYGIIAPEIDADGHGAE